MSPDDTPPGHGNEDARALTIDRVTKDFVDQCGDDRLTLALGQALQQRKPFRRFKDVLAAHPARREAWSAFERQAVEAIARRWCEAHRISPRWAARPSRPTP